MSYSTLQLVMEIFYIFVIVAGLLVLVSSIVAIASSFKSDSKCNGDCEQGRRCTCEEKKDV